MKCSKCGRDNPTESKYCNECGQLLTQPTSVSRIPPVNVPEAAEQAKTTQAEKFVAKEKGKEAANCRDLWGVDDRTYCAAGAAPKSMQHRRRYRRIIRSIEAADRFFRMVFVGRRIAGRHFRRSISN